MDNHSRHRCTAVLPFHSMTRVAIGEQGMAQGVLERHQRAPRTQSCEEFRHLSGPPMAGMLLSSNTWRITFLFGPQDAVFVLGKHPMPTNPPALSNLLSMKSFSVHKRGPEGQQPRRPDLLTNRQGREIAMRLGLPRFAWVIWPALAAVREQVLMQWLREALARRVMMLTCHGKCELHGSEYCKAPSSMLQRTRTMTDRSDRGQRPYQNSVVVHHGPSCFERVSQRLSTWLTRRRPLCTVNLSSRQTDRTQIHVEAMSLFPRAQLCCKD